MLNGAQPQLKANFQKLLDRRTKAQQRLDKAKTTSRGPREKGLVAVFIKEAEAKVAAVGSAVDATGEAELPYLKGIEVLPLQESQDTIAKSEAAIVTLDKAITEARAYIGSKQQECKSFGGAEQKSVREGFSGMQDRISKGAQRISEFKRATANRKRAAAVQACSRKVDALDAESKKVLSAAEPFGKEGAETMTAEAAAAPVKAFLDAEKIFKATAGELSTAIAKLNNEAQGNREQLDALRGLRSRMVKFNEEVAKARKPVSVHEDRFMAKQLVAEANEKIATLDSLVKNVAAGAAALLEQKGEAYLVTTSIQVLSKALS